MIQKIWYLLLKIYVKVGILFFYKKLYISGLENIPKGEAVLFTANHQNAFMDALLLATSVPQQMHYLVRGDIFEQPLIRKALSSLNMMPIFRIRDGWKTLQKNEAIFQKCYDLLLKKERIVIFPEGNHNLKRRLRPLSKGFTRLAFGAIEKDPNLKIWIVPVGLNYTNHQYFRSKAHIVFGQAFEISHYALNNDPQGLKADLSQRMKKLTVHIDNLAQYDLIEKVLSPNNDSWLYPDKTNEIIKQLEHKDTEELRSMARKATQSLPKNTTLQILLRKTLFLINAPILSIWYLVENKMKDPAFIASIKFCFGIFLFPFYYLLVYLLITQIALHPLWNIALIMTTIGALRLYGKLYEKEKRNSQ